MAEERAQRRLAAILAADVVGFSRLMEQDEVGTLAALKGRRKQVLGPMVARYQGRVFKVTGDGVLVEFGSAVNAVQCAVDLQHGMLSANSDLPEDRRIVLRIGVNLGDVMVDGSDLYGDGVNIAARLEGIADPGGILISGTAYDYVKNKIEGSFEDLGTQALKNISEPVRTYRVSGTRDESVKMPRAVTDKPSIAVLPFTNMSGDPEQEYFSDGIAEDIITDLSRVSALFVVARNTSFTFKGKAVEIARAARQMQVGYILEGSVRKAGSRVRIAVQLIDGKTGGHVWAERYDRDFGNIFVLQDEISKSVVGALKVRLLPEELERITDRSTSNAEAYRYYLHGRSLLFGAWGNRHALHTARQMFAKAIEIDPGYARAYAGIADCDANLWAAGETDVSFDDILANSSKALEWAPALAEAHASKGYALYLAGYTDQALQVLKRATELDPNLFEAHFFYGEASREAGRQKDAVAPLERAANLRPSDFWPIAMLSNLYMELGRSEDSRLAAHRTFSCIEAELARRPDNANAWALGACSIGFLGDRTRGEKWARRAVALEPDNWLVRYNVASAYATMGNPDAAMEHLQYMERHMPAARRWMFGIAKIDTDLDPLRDRPDYKELMGRMQTELAAAK